MIGMEFLKGPGLGNQLFCYISARCIAKELGFAFGTAGQEQAGNVAHSRRGLYFMEVDLGPAISPEEAATYRRFDEAEDRLYMGNSRHDINNGCYISGPDPAVWSIADHTLLYGNLQDESYFGKYREDVRGWLRVRKEYDSHAYTQENLCIINMRGGEYTGHPELYLDRRYWLQAIGNMKRIRSDMRFMVVTEDEEAARKVLPEYEIHHFDVGRDYATIKNARYIILSNSSFAVLPVFTSDTIRYAIAPKYWARHNISDGFWSSEQNIYSFLHYQDRQGRIFTPEECRAELEAYKRTSPLYARRNVRPGKMRHACQELRSRWIYGGFYVRKIQRSLGRRTGLIRTFSEGRA